MYSTDLASGGIYEYIPSFVKIGTGVYAMLRLCLRNLKGCNIGTIGARDL